MALVGLGASTQATPVPAPCMPFSAHSQQRSFIHEHARLTAGAPSRLVVVRAASTADRTVAKGEEVPFTAWGTATQRVTKRTDIKSVMVLGAGPIVIGQVRFGCVEGTAWCVVS